MLCTAKGHFQFGFINVIGSSRVYIWSRVYIFRVIYIRTHCLLTALLKVLQWWQDCLSVKTQIVSVYIVHVMFRFSQTESGEYICSVWYWRSPYINLKASMFFYSYCLVEINAADNFLNANTRTFKINSLEIQTYKSLPSIVYNQNGFISLELNITMPIWAKTRFSWKKRHPLDCHYIYMHLDKDLFRQTY